MILDATSSKARRWPERADVRADISQLARPDVIADARYLPFKDGVFSEVYCDPPHFWKERSDDAWARKMSHLSSKGYDRFSYFLSKSEWLEFVRLTDMEFYRVLRPGGKLHYKIPSSRSHGGTIDVNDLRAYQNFVVVSDKPVPSVGALSNINVSRGHARSVIHYVVLSRKEGK